MKKIKLKADHLGIGADMQRKQVERAKYLAKIAGEVTNAINDIFGKEAPPPTGSDMKEILSLVSVLVFAMHIGNICKDKKEMQSELMSAMAALIISIDDYTQHFIDNPEPWYEILNKEGGENDKV